MTSGRLSTEIEKRRILAIEAHPDDVEFVMTGTLALLQQKGCSIYIASLACGDAGSMELNAREIARKRFREGRNAAKILNASYESLGEADLHVLFDNPTRCKVVELIRKVDPHIVFTLSPQDYMIEHEIVSNLVWDACFNASVPNYNTHKANPVEPTKKIPYLYYADAIESKDRFGETIRPSFYVDISSVMKTKVRMLAAHESQRSWLKVQHGMDKYLESMKEQSRQRGKQVDVEYAETFRQHRGHPFPKDNILLELIGVLYKKDE